MEQHRYVKKMDMIIPGDGGHSSVVRLRLNLESWNSNPKTLGSIPWQCRVSNSFSVESTLVQTCLCLIHLHVYGTHPNLCDVKDAISICRKIVGIAAGGMETGKLRTQGKKKLGNAGLWLLDFHWESILNFSCIAL